MAAAAAGDDDEDLQIDWGTTPLPPAPGPAVTTSAPARASLGVVAAASSPPPSRTQRSPSLASDTSNNTVVPEDEKVEVKADPEGNGVMELESDDDENVPPRELELAIGELDDELEDEIDPSGERDPELLPKDTPPYPALPPENRAEPSDARRKVLAKVKRQAAAALEEGNLAKALEKYTEALKTGDATASMLSTRGALLLQQKKPCAAIRDCCAALMLNPDCGKAYHVRGMAHRRLGHYRKAHRDLSQGQKLDFNEEKVAVHRFVAQKIGLHQDLKTGQWEGVKKAVERLLDEHGKERGGPTMAPRSDLRPGQAVKIDGLQKAQHLNGRRGVIQRVDPAGNGRLEVELRLDKGRVETKSLQGKNIFAIKAADARPWKEEERKHAEERKRREAEERMWKEEEERKKMEERRRASEKQMKADGFPEMEPIELLEAEMSTMPLDEEAMGLLRRLKPDTALGILQQGNLGTINNISGYVSLKAKQLLGDPDSEEEPVPARHRTSQTASSSSRPGDLYDPEEEYDPELLEEEKEPFPPSARTENEEETEPTEEQVRRIERARQAAADAMEHGDVHSALDKYTEIILSGGATALVLAKRAEVLLGLRRPCAAIQDCSSALRINPDMAKAFRIRGIAHRRLARWREAHHDLAQGQRLDYDDITSDIQRFVASKLRTADQVASKRRSTAAADQVKRARS
eukprot:TRINITY_DN49708_c0_g1_i1.p1 TRINITY_DN49708_c0_g1~~TRINITY_DN49708_c0_g1_i1.p1  ORF type:complete len:692 (+),score=151.54 TRINITY_DN49708_c0_g1_i1:124-2199(+)